MTTVYRKYLYQKNHTRFSTYLLWPTLISSNEHILKLVNHTCC